MMKLNVLLSRESEERISIRWDAGFLYTSGNKSHRGFVEDLCRNPEFTILHLSPTEMFVRRPQSPLRLELYRPFQVKFLKGNSPKKSQRLNNLCAQMCYLGLQLVVLIN